nr:MAG TPA: hypothetical protein [Caudoviricetes sp.]
MEGIDALLRANGQQPETMNDIEWQEQFKALDFSMKCQEQLLYRAVKRALVEVLNEISKQSNP